MSLKYTVGTVSSLTGLSQHTIRAWERRYGALSPNRTETNRRLYDESDIERLKTLKRFVDSGHAISNVARLSTADLMQLGVEGESGVRSEAPSLTGQHAFPHLAAARAAIGRLSPESLEESLVRGSAAMGVLGLLEGVVIPLLYQIETDWTQGRLTISQEHMATAVLRTHLDRVRIAMPGPINAPRLLVTTPRNQHHELGALMVAIVTAMQSWNVTYLGPNLPAEDIAKAVIQSNSRAVGLSLVFPLADPDLPYELIRLRELLGPSIPIFVGGRASGSYLDVLAQINANVINDFGRFQDALDHAATGKSLHARTAGRRS